MSSLNDAVEIRPLSSGLHVPTGLFGVYGVDPSNGAILNFDLNWALAEQSVIALFDALELAGLFAREMSSKSGAVEDAKWCVKGADLKCHFEFQNGESQNRM